MAKQNPKNPDPNFQGKAVDLTPVQPAPVRLFNPVPVVVPAAAPQPPIAAENVPAAQPPGNAR